jgi:hypothetical protein
MKKPRSRKAFRVLNLIQGAEKLPYPLFLEYQVGGINLPNLFWDFGVEVVWNVGLLLWIFGVPLDKFSTFGGFGVGGGFLATMILALAAQAAGVRSLREEALSQKGAKGVTFG